MTAPTQRIELITRGERRRGWSIEEKQAIVAESLEPGTRPSEVIRRDGITSGQPYRWRHQQFATARFDAIPNIKWWHQPVGIPKQPLPDVVTSFVITCIEAAERMCRVFQDCRRLHESPAVVFDHRT